MKYFKVAIKQSSNERETENVVMDCLRNLDYYGSNNSIQIEEQKSNIENPDFLVIIECNASNNNHISKTLLNNLNHPAADETTEAYNRRTQNMQLMGYCIMLAVYRKSLTLSLLL